MHISIPCSLAAPPPNPTPRPTQAPIQPQPEPQPTDPHRTTAVPHVHMFTPPRTPAGTTTTAWAAGTRWAAAPGSGTCARPTYTTTPAWWVGGAGGGALAGAVQPCVCVCEGAGCVCGGGAGPLGTCSSQQCNCRPTPRGQAKPGCTPMHATSVALLSCASARCLNLSQRSRRPARRLSPPPCRHRHPRPCHPTAALSATAPTTCAPPTAPTASTWTRLSP